MEEEKKNQKNMEELISQTKQFIKAELVQRDKQKEKQDKGIKKWQDKVSIDVVTVTTQLALLMEQRERLDQQLSEVLNSLTGGEHLDPQKHQG